MGSVVCPLCGYNAGENGEKILEIHMHTQHGANASLVLAQQKRESELFLSRTSLVLGVIVLVIGLGLALYGANNYGILSCSSGSCFTPQYLVDQIRTSGLRAVYVGSQETAYAGMLFFAFGSMGVAFWKMHGLRLSQRLVLVLLVGIFLLVFVTALAMAAGFIPFGQRVIFQQ